jgi:hypothetical protein
MNLQMLKHTRPVSCAGNLMLGWTGISFFSGKPQKKISVWFLFERQYYHHYKISITNRNGIMIRVPTLCCGGPGVESCKRDRIS